MFLHSSGSVTGQSETPGAELQSSNLRFGMALMRLVQRIWSFSCSLIRIQNTSHLSLDFQGLVLLARKMKQAGWWLEQKSTGVQVCSVCSVHKILSKRPVCMCTWSLAAWIKCSLWVLWYDFWQAFGSTLTFSRLSNPPLWSFKVVGLDLQISRKTTILRSGVQSVRRNHLESIVNVCKCSKSDVQPDTQNRWWRRLSRGTEQLYFSWQRQRHSEPSFGSRMSRNCRQACSSDDLRHDSWLLSSSIPRRVRMAYTERERERVLIRVCCCTVSMKYGLIRRGRRNLEVQRETPGQYKIVRSDYFPWVLSL